MFRNNQIKVSHFLKKIRFEIRRDAIRVSGIKMFPATMFEAKMKFRIATTAPNISCLFLSEGDVNGSGSITMEKKITVGLSRVIERVFNERPKVTKVKIT